MSDGLQDVPAGKDYSFPEEERTAQSAAAVSYR
jgi:hypothetical protein